LFSYYFNLALRSLRRNPVLTGLMVIAIAVGVGTSLTSLSVSRAIAGDPIPERSHQLFMVQIDSWGPDKRGERNSDGLDENMSYIDAMGLAQLHAAEHQTRIFSTQFNVRTADPKIKPFGLVAPAVDSDFFAMFQAPFRFGAPWGRAEDEDGAPVVVISRKTNDRLFAGKNSVGNSVTLGETSYRVVGVLENWPLVPRFYNLHIRPYGQIDEIFIPFSRAIKAEVQSASGMSCQETANANFEARLRSECLWIQLWVQLPTSNEIAKFRAALNNYAHDQQQNGRFHWPPHTQVRDVMQWLEYRHVVPNELGLLVLASFGFLFVCLMNAMGLMLARIMGRTQDIGIRRALGASRSAIVHQCVIETAVIAVLGAGLGLALTALGILVMRFALADDFAALTYFKGSAVAIDVLFAVVAVMVAGLYPIWRAARVAPALQLKAE
jgi:putative ABC transport system permease protein